MNEWIKDPKISRRMRLLCGNCQWLEKEYDACRELRKAFDCTKYQVRQEIEEKRASDDSLNNPYGWLGQPAKPSV